MTLAPGFALAAPVVSCSALLTSTYRRLAVLCQSLQVDIAEPGSPAAQGWADGAELAGRPELLDAFLDAEARRIHNRHAHTARRDVVASRALHDYLWSVSLLMSGPWYLERRVPRIRPYDVRISLTTGAYGIVPGGFACLPDDPAAELPGARVVAHEEALRDELRAAVADHVRPLLAAIGPQLRRGPRALWGMVGDDLVSGIWYLGRMLGQEEQAVRAAGELLPGPVPPFPGGADFRRLTGREGQSYTTRTRLGCCLYYTIRPAEACGTCPRTCDTERVRRLEGDAPA
ncbi:(2Fe-2S)-binding protein [Streptomyces sp. NBC_01142]|uniref:(2Fe-2S)-binding protein n=1 Tax=Streptomyces sp. NBC_01142 TaxID=2975865 RepID=UPI00225932B4|nr:(2Fe-2S)-binding protein [Streptomyces sp. NBC_01142]MCX4820887.1 (2Fe-2S)-binding protein [Streptomyces sp. NBC_01142]